MSRDPKTMTFDEITEERLRLFNQGGLELCEVKSFTGAYRRAAGIMLPIDRKDEEAAMRAARYNILAAHHYERFGSAKRRYGHLPG